ncbi:MAG: butyrate kinase [Oscillospiraceae bacterium]
MSKNIFVINPGSTSTKIACYQDDRVVFSENLWHPQANIVNCKSVIGQNSYRLQRIWNVIDQYHIDVDALDIVIGRGGMFPPVKSGAYLVDDDLIALIREGNIEQHASNLGGLLAKAIADKAGVNAFVYDCVSVDEFPPISKITGIPEISRQSFCHVLNSKAVVRKYAESLGKRYEDMTCIVAHLGGGFSFSAHQKGRIVDSISDDGGAFSPERAGSVPILYIIEMCYSGRYSYQEMCSKVRGMGGLRALLGTSDCRKVEEMIAGGDAQAKLIYDAMILQIAKAIALTSAILKGKLDAVIITGGVAHSKYITERVIDYVKYLGEVIVIPGEYEMEALAAGGSRLLNGEAYHTISGGSGQLKL